MNKKIGLIVQGPLLSIGRTGDKLHQSLDQLRQEGGVINYDCRENIQKIIDDFGPLFDEVVISTWDNEVKPGDVWQGAKLIHAPDPGGIKQAGHYKDNNKYRQFVSTLNGLLELEKSGVEYAIKTRTDTYPDLKKMVESFWAGMEKNKNPDAIYVTVRDLPIYLLHDLYFASSTKAMKKFCEDILAYDRFEFISSVHREMVLKHAYSSYKKRINVPDWAYFPVWPPDGVSAQTRKIFNHMLNEVFFPLDPNVFRTILWRGVRFSEDHVSALLEAKNKPRKYNIPGLFSTDWGRYFHFRLQESGEKITFGNRMKISIGKWGWKLWNTARKTARMARAK